MMILLAISSLLCFAHCQFAPRGVLPQNYNPLRPPSHTPGQTQQHSQMTARSGFGYPAPAATKSTLPNLSFSDMLALRRALLEFQKQNSLTQRSGAVPPSNGLPSLGGVYGLSSYPSSGSSGFPQIPDYLQTAASHQVKQIKPSITTRFRSFMNSLFFRRSGSQAPAFYQPPASPYASQPFRGSSSAYPSSYGGKIPTISSNDFYSSLSGGKSSKPYSKSSSFEGYPPHVSSSSSFSSPSFVPSPVSSSQSSSLPSGVSSISKHITSSGSASSPNAAASSFYPSSVSSPSSAYDKGQYSSLYGTNGFTAKTVPSTGSGSVKSSKSLKANLPSEQPREKSSSVSSSISVSSSSPTSSSSSKTTDSSKN